MSLPFEITKFLSRKTAVAAATLYLISEVPATDQATIIAKIAGMALVGVAFIVAQAWSNRGPKTSDNCADTDRAVVAPISTAPGGNNESIQK